LFIDSSSFENEEVFQKDDSEEVFLLFKKSLSILYAGSEIATEQLDKDNVIERSQKQEELFM
jgi:hypothetical protein